MKRPIEFAYLWSDMTWETRVVDIDTDKDGNYDGQKAIDYALSLIVNEPYVVCSGCFIYYEPQLEEDES